MLLPLPLHKRKRERRKEKKREREKKREKEKEKKIKRERKKERSERGVVFIWCNSLKWFIMRSTESQGTHNGRSGAEGLEHKNEGSK